MNCKNCGAPLEKDNEICPYCGAVDEELADRKEAKQREIAAREEARLREIAAREAEERKAEREAAEREAERNARARAEQRQSAQEGLDPISWIGGIILIIIGFCLGVVPGVIMIFVLMGAHEEPGFCRSFLRVMIGLVTLAVATLIYLAANGYFD